MAISTDWDNEEKTILLSVFEDEWTWADFHDAAKEMHSLIRTVDHSVDLILYHKHPQPLGNPLIHFNSVQKTQPANVGQVIVVNPHMNAALMGFLKVLSNVVMKANKSASAVQIVDNMEEARRTINKANSLKH